MTCFTIASPRPDPSRSRDRAIIEPVELAEDALVLRLRDAGPVVAHGEPRLLLVERDEDIDFHRIPAVFVGVGEQIEERVGDRAAIGADQQRLGRQAHVELDRAALAHGLEGFEGRRDHRLQVGLAECKFAPTAFHAPPIEQAVDQLLQAGAFARQALDALLFGDGVSAP